MKTRNLVCVAAVTLVCVLGGCVPSGEKPLAVITCPGMCAAPGAILSFSGLDSADPAGGGLSFCHFEGVIESGFPASLLASEALPPFPGPVIDEVSEVFLPGEGRPLPCLQPGLAAGRVFSVIPEPLSFLEDAVGGHLLGQQGQVAAADARQERPHADPVVARKLRRGRLFQRQAREPARQAPPPQVPQTPARGPAERMTSRRATARRPPRLPNCRGPVKPITSAARPGNLAVKRVIGESQCWASPAG